MQIIDSPQHTRHDPPFEILDGERTPYFEAPRRAAIIAGALAAAGFPAPTAPREFGLGPLLAVHRQDYVEYLERAHGRWVAAGLSPDGVMPCTLPLGGMAGRSTAPTAEAGRYCFDLSAPIVAGTYAAARCAADAALTGAEVLLAGTRAAYALCRPPGHHAMPALAGGYCYLNNAAIAAHHLAAAAQPPDAEVDRRPWAMAPPSVAVLDIDYHHGNGTQAIFYERSDVLFASIHADPDREYPYFLGFADERGAGPGEGYNLNIPLEAGVDDARYLAALEQALEAIAAYSPRYLVVSVGLDTFAEDPLGDFALTSAAYPAIGARIAQLGLPTLFVQEGGYAVEALGNNVVELLRGYES
ncbi:histone deacetylase family protein [Oscillochloris sp. ZM17-4]|uniref:histone deacetylase family protein n=1 Tax=Oscillochloris sp. ZM17-4 TaxID=2866714 RepID=UPI001C7313F2|nr:histone deacetylase family protein [Oscillochloris sp. ZM17-4]MBX0327454.1 histone deacetylase family protein [Oscillochloris sp. ZM17-4]